MYKNKPGTQIKVNRTHFWILRLTLSWCNAVSNTSLMSKILYLTVQRLASIPPLILGDSGMHKCRFQLGWVGGPAWSIKSWWVSVKHFVTEGLKLLKGQLLWDWKLHFFLWKCESLIFPCWAVPQHAAQWMLLGGRVNQEQSPAPAPSLLSGQDSPKKVIKAGRKLLAGWYKR